MLRAWERTSSRLSRMLWFGSPRPATGFEPTTFCLKITHPSAMTAHKPIPVRAVEAGSGVMSRCGCVRPSPENFNWNYTRIRAAGKILQVTLLSENAGSY
ncbi:hypothetical protein EVAR_57923_1 [Eumeta japonica]|uniref:Uncharacterized protein n=1 Tax=Eumeta variegata TaxID=151549 RepID=A0A4C1ZQH2_EUMVA|nr:hypothetical protein EVAR_57923_1 [Eumeta japonica]